MTIQIGELTRCNELDQDESGIPHRAVVAKNTTAAEDSGRIQEMAEGRLIHLDPQMDEFEHQNQLDASLRQSQHYMDARAFGG